MTGKLVVHIRSNVVAYLALFIALGGTSYAAIKLPRNSVGSKQLRANAVTSGKVKNGTLRTNDFSASALRRGTRGPTGPPGPAGAVTATLPSGKTLRGRWAVSGVSPDAAPGDIESDALSFGAQLSAAPKRVFVFTAGSGGTQCPGTADAPEAAAGILCFYVEYQNNINNGIETIIGTTSGATSRQGAELYIVNNATTPGGFGARGSWAVTAP
jgi:hypothetical protein